MQENAKELYKAIARVISKQKQDRGIKYTELCYENDIATTTYDDIVNAKRQASFYNIAKIAKGLGLSFGEFGELLDKELPLGFMNDID